MEKQKIFHNKLAIVINKIIATVFGIGYIPFGQGTIASLAGVVMYLAISKFNNMSLMLLATMCLTIMGFLVSGEAERMFGQKDSGKIVIDEVSGIFIAYLFISTSSYQILIVGFLLYRFFDIIKLYPINRLERLPSGWGIMLDDIAAGLYTNIILQILAKIRIC